MNLNALSLTLLFPLLAGCISSDYPLLTKEESTTLVAPGRYCFAPTPANKKPLHASECGWATITLNKTNGYTFTIIEDPHKTLALTKAKPYFDRIFGTPLESGSLKGWNILQHCESNQTCNFAALYQKKKGIFAIAYPPLPANTPENASAFKVKSKDQLVKTFQTLKRHPTKTIVFCTPEHLSPEKPKTMKSKPTSKEKYRGDL